MSQYELPVLEVSDIPQLAFDNMNDTHGEEVELVNKLGQALLDVMQGRASSDDVSEKLEEWIEHTREHFSTENQLMENSGFPAIEVHSAEHSRVLEQLEAIQQQWQASHQAEPVADFLFNEWVQWFDNHVNTMDMVTAQYVIQAEETRNIMEQLDSE